MPIRTIEFHTTSVFNHIAAERPNFFNRFLNPKNNKNEIEYSLTFFCLI